MKKIGVISDTHLRDSNRLMETIMENYFYDAALVIHAGDMVTLDVLDAFTSQGTEIVGVCGNMDFPDVQRTYPASRMITVEDLRIGITHGWGAPGGIRDRIRKSFDDVDIIIYGHTHRSFAASESGVYFFNPGSPTDSRFTSVNSIGIIQINGKDMEGTIISL
ncbi:MAG TPA: metallophosphoesterase [Deltaproteobacteria bacterium]|nr:metallophosphoesterase [Deltaproteobacteria bacterium]